ncbi:TetR-like C-terminal domain-containing protein, partial [Jiangella muralis]|uniref:TetR-like C-terminal domain-containing protein n=1 Tax=Jiangella muralis TaxID=702383 RepID=UPI001969A501
SPPRRWRAVCHAVRDWALAHPHEYALIYGSPVPGYQAPVDTVEPAVRDTVVYGRILSSAYAAGVLSPPDGFPAPPPSFAGDAEAVRALMPGLPDDLIARAVTAWTGLFGFLSFELFGQFANVVEDRATLFDHQVATLGRLAGLPAA